MSKKKSIGAAKFLAVYDCTTLRAKSISVSNENRICYDIILCRRTWRIYLLKSLWLQMVRPARITFSVSMNTVRHFDVFSSEYVKSVRWNVAAAERRVAENTRRDGLNRKNKKNYEFWKRHCEKNASFWIDLFLNGVHKNNASRIRQKRKFLKFRARILP